MKLTVEVIGWMGALLILLSYALLSAGKLKADSLTYQSMNILGAAGFLVNSGWHGALPSAVLNLVWMGIGVYAVRQHRQQLRTRCAN
jgi:predicted membrane metal-binding protein